MLMISSSGRLGRKIYSLPFSDRETQLADQGVHVPDVVGVLVDALVHGVVVPVEVVELRDLNVHFVQPSHHGLGDWDPGRLGSHNVPSRGLEMLNSRLHLRDGFGDVLEAGDDLVAVLGPGAVEVLEIRGHACPDSRVRLELLVQSLDGRLHADDSLLQLKAHVVAPRAHERVAHGVELLAQLKATVGGALQLLGEVIDGALLFADDVGQPRHGSSDGAELLVVHALLLDQGGQLLGLLQARGLDHPVLGHAEPGPRRCAERNPRWRARRDRARAADDLAPDRKLASAGTARL